MINIVLVIPREIQLIFLLLMQLVFAVQKLIIMLLWFFFAITSNKSQCLGSLTQPSVVKKTCDSIASQSRGFQKTSGRITCIHKRFHEQETAHQAKGQDGLIQLQRSPDTASSDASLYGTKGKLATRVQARKKDTIICYKCCNKREREGANERG